VNNLGKKIPELSILAVEAEEKEALRAKLTQNLADYRVLENPGGNRAVVRLNNLNSFSSRLEHAWEFGGNVFEADVPASKIFFRADLLRGVLPRGEEEAMVIGGDFEVMVRSY
jgi:NAD+--dinitrogen-reductase ADP-D-ribosyltransferase